ncbi:McrC family protein [Gemmatimonadota bacterium]
MRVEKLTESKWRVLNLTQQEVEALQVAGRALASDTSWWGEEEETNIERTVIRCRPHSPNHWEVEVSNAIGLIALDTLQIEVNPKIPLPHLLYLFEKSTHFPRMADDLVAALKGISFWRLLYLWYLSELEQVIRRGLVRDYHEISQTLKVVRGKIDPITTLRSVYSGRLDIPCEYEEYNFDTPLNRVLVQAGKIVRSSSSLQVHDRGRAGACLARIGRIGEYVPHDLRTSIDRRSAHYRNALQLAHHILCSVGRTVKTGETYAKTFLIRTPEMVEEGIRRILKERLGQFWSIEKHGIRIPGTSMTLNPDLVFDNGVAVGDVKYKLFSGDWNRGDLYQLISFAEGYGATRGCLLGFQTGGVSPAPITVGTKHLRSISWPAYEEIQAYDASQQVVNEVREWL